MKCLFAGDRHYLRTASGSAIVFETFDKLLIRFLRNRKSFPEKLRVFQWYFRTNSEIRKLIEHIFFVLLLDRTHFLVNHLLNLSIYTQIYERK